jgi:DedD protein
MGLLSIFKRRAEAPPTPAAASDTSEAVLRARTRARQRLIGAAVLVVIGIIGFPLVFETQPRPIPVDIPIELPRRDGAPALVMPPARVPAATPAASAVSSAVQPAASAASAPQTPSAVITESREEAGREVGGSVTAAQPAKVASAAVRSGVKPPVKPASATVADAPLPPANHQPAPGPAPTDGARARALLDGKSTAAAVQSGRFVVQVGAFADPGAARETRLKVEKLGLKTYTQVASTTAGNRIRVRVGPFGTRDEADKAMAKARGAGLSAVVLTL